MAKFTAVAGDNTGHFIADHHAPKRLEAIGHCFGKGQKIRLRAIGLATKQFTGAGKATDYFVTYKQNVSLFKDATDFWPVAVWWHYNATSPLNGLGNKRGNIFLTQFVNALFQLTGSIEAEFFFAHIATIAVPVWLSNMVNIV